MPTIPQPRGADLARVLGDWASANELAQPVGLFLKQADHIRGPMAKASAAWPERLAPDAVLDPSGMAALADDPLLTALLTGAPVCDIELERLFTNVRLALLHGERAGAAASSNRQPDCA